MYRCQNAIGVFLRISLQSIRYVKAQYNLA